MKSVFSQDEVKAFVDVHVYLNQSFFVEHLLEEGVVSYDEIENYTYSNEELKDEGFSDEEIERGDVQREKEIFEWWLISDLLARWLREQGEPVLESAGCAWWGRTCTGQAIYLDCVIEKIYGNVMMATR